MSTESNAAAPAERRPPVWWVLVRHEWRLTMRDVFAGTWRRRRPGAPARKVGRVRRVVVFVVGLVLMHLAGLMTLAMPRRWQDTPANRFAVVVALAFLVTWMLSYTMSRIVTAFHERRDLDLLLSAPIDPALVLAVRALTIVAAATATFAFFLYPIADVGVVVGRWWTARLYPLVPLLAFLATGLALVLADAVVRLVGVRRARVGLQVFSALVGASMYFVTQARQFLSKDTTTAMANWIGTTSRGSDAPAPIVFAAALARGDWLAWIGLAVASGSLFAAATVGARRRFVEIAQTPESAARVARPTAAVLDRRFARAFSRGVFATLLWKEWKLVLRAPQLLSQVLLQVLYLMPLMFVALRSDGGAIGWGPAAFAGAIVGIASTLATALAWLTVAAEDAPDLIAGSPGRPGVVLAAKLVAAAGPPIAIVAIAAAGTLQRSAVEAAIVAGFGALACTSAAILSAASPVAGKRSDFQKRHRGRGVSEIVETLQFMLWAAAAGTAGAGYWLASGVLTAIALVMPSIRLPAALRRFNTTD